MDYELIRSSRRTLALEITRRGRVLAPRPTPGHPGADRFLLSLPPRLAGDPPPARGGPSGRPSHARRRPGPGPPGQGAGGHPRAGAVLQRPDGPQARQPHHHRRQDPFRLLLVPGAHLLLLASDAVPPEAVDYVVVHELAHLVHQNHGPEFYKLVASVLPDYRQRAALLQF